MKPYRVTTRLGALIVEIINLDFPLNVEWQRFIEVEGKLSPHVQVHLECGESSRADWQVSRPLWADGNADTGVLKAALTEWEATFDLANARVDARIAGRWPLAVGSLLKMVVQLYPPGLGIGFILHAASVEKDGEAYVFMGRSGAGKTTAALESAGVGMNALSEEMTYLRFDENGGGVSVCVLPFRQRGRLTPEQREYPVRRVYWLEQGQRDEVIEIPLQRDRFRLTAAATAVGIRHSIMMDLALDQADRLVRAVPVKRLVARKGPGFWAAIERDVTA